MAKLFYLIFLVATFAVSPIAGRSPSPSPSPSDGCSDAVMGMADCLDYVKVGGNSTAPPPACCVELNKVVNVSTSCLCEGLKMVSDLGVKLNMTRVLTVPRDCRVQAFGFDHCIASPAPAPVPARATPGPAPSPISPSPTKPVPVSAPTPSKHSPAPLAGTPPPPPPPTLSPSVAPVEPPVQGAPSPSPAAAESGSRQLSGSMMVLFVGLVIASFSYVHV